MTMEKRYAVCEPFVQALLHLPLATLMSSFFLFPPKIMYFCYDFLKYITSEEYSVNAPDRYSCVILNGME